MSYRDPYVDPYVSQPQPRQHRYVDSVGTASGTTYTNSNDQTLQSYERDFEPYDGYRDEPDPPHAALPLNDSDYSSETAPAPPAKDRSLEHDFAATTQPPQKRTVKALKRYRHDVQGNLWMKGSRLRCFGRFCCCTIMISLFLFISIVLSIVLWIRPPNIDIGNVAPRGSTQVTADGLNISLGVTIAVDNPNFFSVTLKNIAAEINYPINNTNIGRGQESNIVFPSNTRTTFTFPFLINYRMDHDPDNRVLVDLATKCGVIGGVRSDIVVRYKISIRLQVFFITISPDVANTFTFPCPVSSADFQKLLRDAGLGGLIGG